MPAVPVAKLDCGCGNSYSMKREGDGQSCCYSHSKKRDPEYGGVAQLGEHLPCKQGVMGSNPIISTSPTKLDKEARETRYTERN